MPGSFSIPCFIGLIIVNIVALISRKINNTECIILSLIACALPFFISLSSYRLLAYACLGILLLVVNNLTNVVRNSKNISNLMIVSSVIIYILAVFSTAISLGYLNLVYFSHIIIPIFVAIILLNLILYKISVFNKYELLVSSSLALLLRIFLVSSTTLQVIVYGVIGVICFMLQKYPSHKMRLDTLGKSMFLTPIFLFLLIKIVLFISPAILKLTNLGIIK